MGLTHPFDLAAWQAWQRSGASLARKVRLALHGARGTVTTVVRARRGVTPRVVVVLDAWSPSSLLSLWAPLVADPDLDAVVIAPSASDQLTGWESREVSLSEALEDVTGGMTVLSTGHYLPLGAAAHARAARVGARFCTVQHGLMTPHAPPLAPESTLLAWSAADGDFWRSGRSDVEVQVVGSQLLYAAGQGHAVPVHPDATPVYLGQLHAAELDRASNVRSTGAFLERTGATYRPHPGEQDRRSRAQHAKWAARGIPIDRSARPLHEIGAPVVSAFSTGVLEAAAVGLPAWVHFEGPPAWLLEFWERYGMHPWGDAPTPAPAMPAVAPASAIAHLAKG